MAVNSKKENQINGEDSFINAVISLISFIKLHKPGAWKPSRFHFLTANLLNCSWSVFTAQLYLHLPQRKGIVLGTLSRWSGFFSSTDS